MKRSLAVVAIGFAYSFFQSVQAEDETMQRPPTTVAIDWRFDHPPKLVWKAWTDPEWISAWVGSDPKGSVRHVNTDVRPGGQFEFAFADSDGTQHTARGVYSGVVPYRKLAFSWNWASEPGIETSVIVELADEGGETLMRFEHGGLIHASTHDYAQGWRSTFEKMSQVLERLSKIVGQEP